MQDVPLARWVPCFSCKRESHGHHTSAYSALSLGHLGMLMILKEIRRLWAAALFRISCKIEDNMKE